MLANGYLIGPGANLSNADLTTANLVGVRSGGVTGTPALPTDWKLIGGFLIGPGANLSNATLSGFDLTGTSLLGANLTGVRSGAISGTPALPADWRLMGGYLFGPHANLTAFGMEPEAFLHFDFVDINLSHANLSKARLNHRVDFFDANLAYADLSYADLTDAALFHTNLTNANLTGANLTGVIGAAKYNSATILPAGFDPVAAGWTLVS